MALKYEVLLADSIKGKKGDMISNGQIHNEKQTLENDFVEICEKKAGKAFLEKLKKDKSYSKNIKGLFSKKDEKYQNALLIKSYSLR